MPDALYSTSPPPPPYALVESRSFRPSQTSPDGTPAPSQRLPDDDPQRAAADAFPADASPADQLTFMLNWAVRAPSVLNTQPWLFAVDGRLVRLHADRTRQLRVLDPDGRALAISCGAALFFLDVAAHHFGYATETYLQPVAEHPDVLGTLLLAHGGEPTDEDEALFAAADARHAGSGAFDLPSLSAHVADRLTRAAETEGVHLHVIADRDEKERIADLVAMASLAQADDARLQDEMRAWLRDANDQRRDGMSELLRSLWDRHASAHIPPSRVAEHRRRLAAEAPALLVLTTDADGTIAWLTAGRALGRLVLTAAAESISLSYVNQPVEVDSIRPRLGELVGAPFPQLVLGVGTAASHTRGRRRPVRHVLLEPHTQEWNWTMI